ncbi:hypothetical protein GGQ97_001592 [Sphingomonas kaistensis]|uniref:Uncharacterized protein n=1 Tax=Sphingomonas kaistensis TaxID=298708 RepID=A0A7X6BFV3_9SPHN|nr:hypothetical protein [Sphingomonas kaistensis]
MSLTRIEGGHSLIRTDQRHREQRRKLRPSSAYTLVLAVLLIGAVISAPWVLPIFLAPVPNPRKPPIMTKAPSPSEEAAIKANNDRKLLREAIEEFDADERTRAAKLHRAREQLSVARADVLRRLRGEAEQIASRMAKPAFAGRLYVAKSREWLPDLIGGDPGASDKLVTQAVDTRTSTIQASYAQQARALVHQASGRTATFGVPTSAESITIQAKLGRFIAMRASRDMSRFAKGSAVRVIKKAVPRFPAAALDGPLPGAEMALFGATIVDIYNQGSEGQRVAQRSITASAMQMNQETVERVSRAAEKDLFRNGELQRLKACARLLSNYRRTPIPELSSAVSGRCY